MENLKVLKIINKISRLRDKNGDVILTFLDDSTLRINYKDNIQEWIQSNILIKKEYASIIINISDIKGVN